MSKPQTPLHLPTWPKVSVIVLNYNGREHLDPCFNSLAQTDYPGEMELIFVDNASTDPSVEHMQRYHPGVKIVTSSSNLGFVGGNNLGVRAAQGEYVVFLNNDMRVEADWLRHLVAPLDPENGLICTGGKILRWDGRAVDFVGGHINFTGHGFQKDYGAPYTPLSYLEPIPLPFACGGCMCIQRDIYDEVGGFDDDFFAYFEDVDLGYRLWALGYRILFAPQAIVYHRHHGTSGSMANHQLRVLYERNSLSMIVKNYEEATLNKILPIALMLTVKRSLLNARLDRSHYQLGNGSAAARQEAETVPRLAFSFLLGIEEFGDQLPKLLEKRSVIQSRRIRTDREIFALFNDHLLQPIFPGMDYANTQETLVDSLAIPDFFTNPAPVRLLLICHDQIGEKMAGPAVRYWELARVLSQSHTVTLAAHGKPALTSPDFAVRGYDRAVPDSIIHLLNEADVIFTFGYLIHELPALQNLGKPLIVDIYDPFTLENLEVHSHLPAETQHSLNNQYQEILNRQLQVGDFFVCASQRQRDYWLGMLAANGRINPSTYADDKRLRRLIDVVPFGLPKDPPIQSGPALKGVHPGVGADDRVILWGGGIWEWFDPLSLIQAMAQIVPEHPDVKLFFMGKQHLDPSVVPTMTMPGKAEALARELGLLDRHVFFGDWIPYQQRHNYLLEADVAVSMHVEHIETRYAFRTRILDYIWAGLPMVLTEGDIMAEEAAQAGVARLVQERDPEAIAQALLEMLALAPEEKAQMAASFNRLREQYAWEQGAQPIIDFCRNPTLAPDKRDDLAARSLPARPAVPAAASASIWSLPGKVIRALRLGGWRTLHWEAQRYIAWRKQMWKQGGKRG